MSKSSKSSGSRSSSKSKGSLRSKSKASVLLEMFPVLCSASFINRTRKASFQKLAEDLGIPTGEEDSDDEDVWIEYTKGTLCHMINNQTSQKKATIKQKKTKRKVKNARTVPKKAAHKS